MKLGDIIKGESFQHRDWGIEERLYWKTEPDGAGFTAYFVRVDDSKPVPYGSLRGDLTILWDDNIEVFVIYKAWAAYDGVRGIEFCKDRAYLDFPCIPVLAESFSLLSKLVKKYCTMDCYSYHEKSLQGFL